MAVAQARELSRCRGPVASETNRSSSPPKSAAVEQSAAVGKDQRQNSRPWQPCRAARGAGRPVTAGAGSSPKRGAVPHSSSSAGIRPSTSARGGASRSNSSGVMHTQSRPPCSSTRRHRPSPGPTPGMLPGIKCRPPMISSTIGACPNTRVRMAHEPQPSRPAMVRGPTLNPSTTKYGHDKQESPRVTVVWNGTKVHDDLALDRPTASGRSGTPAAGAIRLQDHGNKVRFRNIQVRLCGEPSPTRSGTVDSGGPVTSATGPLRGAPAPCRAWLPLRLSDRPPGRATAALPAPSGPRSMSRTGRGCGTMETCGCDQC